MNVLLVGSMASGKTTVASVLMENGYERLAFADGVRDVAKLAYGNIQKGEMFQIKDIYQGYVEITGRQILQRVGQEVKRVDEEFWLRIIEQKMHDGGNYVIDDGRFDFELEWGRNRGFLVVGVNTSEPIRIQRYETMYGRTPSQEEMTHPSEQQIPQLLLECDLNIQGSEDPYWNARKILDAIGRFTPSPIGPSV